MNFSIEDILHLTADMQEFSRFNDPLDSIVAPFTTDELDVDELEFVSAAKSSAPSYQVFRNTILSKAKDLPK